MTSDYAIVETGGKQYRVEEGDVFVVDRLAADEGAKVSLRAVMFRDEDNVVLEPKELEKVKVEAKVAAHERGTKIMVFKYKAKKGYRRRQGHRSELTRLEVTDVKLLSRRPAKPKAAPADAADSATSVEAKVAVESTSAPAPASKAEPKPKAPSGEAAETAKPAAKPKPKSPKAQTKADSSADDESEATGAAKPEAAAGAKPAAKSGDSSKKGSAGSPTKGKAASSKTPTSAKKKET